MECVRLRVKDVDFTQNQIVVRDGEGQKDRVTILPKRFQTALRERLVRIKEQHEKDLADVSTTMIYTHVLNKPGLAVKSPADE